MAVFDLDGTITRHDTLASFAFGYLLHHRIWRLPCLLAVLPACARFLLGRADAGDLKSAFIRATLGGAQRPRLEAWAARFVQRLIPDGVFAAALARLAQHVADGDTLVLMSASTDLYVPQIGRALGFGQVICTGLLWHGEQLDGHLSTPNRRGEEKVRCMARLRAEHPGRAFAAYGNADSDLPHLRMVERPLLVNGSRSARALASRYGIPQASWQ